MQSTRLYTDIQGPTLTVNQTPHIFIWTRSTECMFIPNKALYPIPRDRNRLSQHFVPFSKLISQNGNSKQPPEVPGSGSTTPSTARPRTGPSNCIYTPLSASFPRAQSFPFAQISHREAIEKPNLPNVGGPDKQRSLGAVAGCQ